MANNATRHRQTASEENVIKKLEKARYDLSGSRYCDCIEGAIKMAMELFAEEYDVMGNGDWAELTLHLMAKDAMNRFRDEMPKQVAETVVLSITRADLMEVCPETEDWVIDKALELARYGIGNALGKAINKRGLGALVEAGRMEYEAGR